MNKYLILLGLVLLASLSFAQGWMQYVEGRYSCTYDYNYHLLELLGPGCEILTEDEFFEAIDTYFECRGCMLDNVYMMMSSAGCSRAPTDPALFRSSMSLFNSKALLFRQMYVAKIRECLADPRCLCTSEDILEDMGDFRSDYAKCAGENPECREPEEGGHDE